MQKLMVEELVLKICARGEKPWSAVENLQEEEGFLSAFVKALGEFQDDPNVWENRESEENRKRYMIGEESRDGGVAE